MAFILPKNSARKICYELGLAGMSSLLRMCLAVFSYFLGLSSSGIHLFQEQLPILQFLKFLFYFVVLWIEPRASCKLDKHFTELQSLALNSLTFAGIKGLLNGTGKAEAVLQGGEIPERTLKRKTGMERGHIVGKLGGSCPRVLLICQGIRENLLGDNSNKSEAARSWHGDELLTPHITS